MKNPSRWLKDLFSPANIQGIDLEAVAAALNDSETRRLWLEDLFEEVLRMNMEVDRRLLSANNLTFPDLCARRQAFQYVLESALRKKRDVAKSVPRHNPRPVVEIDLDRVTA